MARKINFALLVKYGTAWQILHNAIAEGEIDYIEFETLSDLTEYIVNNGLPVAGGNWEKIPTATELRNYIKDNEIPVALNLSLEDTRQGIVDYYNTTG